MNYLHLIYQLPAVVAGTVTVAYVLPWKLAPRFAPLLMFAVALAVMRIPAWVCLALALTIPAAWLSGKLGIDLHSHEPLKIRLPQLRMTRMPLTEFAERAYPDPAEDPDGKTEPPGPAETRPPEPALASRSRSFVPDLPD